MLIRILLTQERIKIQTTLDPGASSRTNPLAVTGSNATFSSDYRVAEALTQSLAVVTGLWLSTVCHHSETESATTLPIRPLKAVRPPHPAMFGLSELGSRELMSEAFTLSPTKANENTR